MDFLQNLFFKNLHKIGYRYFEIYRRKKSDRLVVKIFQQRYLPNKVTGSIDKKTYKISNFLANHRKSTWNIRHYLIKDYC